MRSDRQYDAHGLLHRGDQKSIDLSFKFNGILILSVLLLCFSIIGCDSETGGDAILSNSNAGCTLDGEERCGGLCVNTTTDRQHCGQCDSACPNGLYCVEGTCQVSGCGETSGELLCDGGCVNSNTDTNHCGMCGLSCEGDSLCMNGECACSSGLSYCVDACVNLQTDPMNCGSCRAPCLEDQTCFEGRCRAPRQELCNGEDDDIDGLIDEDEDGRVISVDCSNLCGPGGRICENATYTECTAPAGEAEICDMVDNDCDGLVDEDITLTYFEDRDGDGHGASDLTTALSTCSEPPLSGPNGGPYVTSNRDCNDNNDSVFPNAEEICDTIDNNCDGVIDEGCACSPGESRICGSDIGRCQAGEQLCLSTGEYGTCEGLNYVAPRAETCDAVDEDCDGETDEDLLEDVYEVLEMRQSNDRCEVAHSLETSVSGQAPITVNSATLYHSDQSADVDWYSVSSTDDLGACVPTRGQCIRFVVEFIHPENVDPGDYELCAHELLRDNALCQSVAEHCISNPEITEYDAQRRTYTLTLPKQGRCGLDDTTHYNLEVRSRSNVATCASYTLRVRTDLENSDCP